MSASLMVFIPLVLFGLATTLCFAGCAFVGYDLSGYHAEPTYQNTVATDPNIVAFWPLDDLPPSTTALDIAQKTLLPAFNGDYFNPVTLKQAGIVVGDVQDNGTANTCASFGGGKVQVKFQEALNSSVPFTLECWVLPAWADTDKNVHAVVVTTDLAATAQTGYALFCDDKNFWSASIGLGQTDGFMRTVPDPSSQPAALDKPMATYLALTFDGTTANVYVNPSNATPYATVSVPKPGMSKFAPSVSPLPLFIGLGRPDMPPGQLPFSGKIQDVAFYSRLLTPAELMAHFNLGNTPPG